MTLFASTSLPLAEPARPGLGLIGVILAAMLLHATWNALAKAMRDQVIAFGLLAASSGAVGAILIPLTTSPARASWGYAGTSVCLHVAYSVALLNSYRLGDLSQVYPLARGMAPVLVTAGAVVVASEVPDAQQLVGLAVIVGGLVSLVGVRRAADTDPHGIGFAALTGVIIATYTVVDGLGVRRSGSPLGYAAWLFFVEGAILTAGFVAVKRPAVRREAERSWCLGVAAGVLSVVAYALVLWAQTRVALATVSALRETSVVAAAMIGTVCLHEGHARRRLLAATVVAAGVAVMVTA